MKQVLVLCWGLLALAGAAPSPLPNRALEMVLEEFHNKSHVQFVFKQQSVAESMDVLQMGTFVNLEVDLVQTVCRKSQRGGTSSCQNKPGGRKQKCLACFKFDSSENVLDKSVRCLSPQVPIFQQVKKRQVQECEQVKMVGEEHYRPGVFAFSKGRPLWSD